MTPKVESALSGYWGWLVGLRTPRELEAFLKDFQFIYDW